MGSSNVGVFKWMEDEDYFEFEDDVVIGGNLSVSGDFSALNLPIEPSTATSQYVCWDTDGHIFLNETGC